MGTMNNNITTVYSTAPSAVKKTGPVSFGDALSVGGVKVDVLSNVQRGGMWAPGAFGCGGENSSGGSS